MTANLLSIDAMLRQLVECGLRTEKKVDALAAVVLKPKSKKEPKPVESPEQWMARLRAEFKDQPAFDVELAKCKDHYRVLRQRCGRDTVEKWLLRNRKWRTERGVPDAPEKKRGLVL